MSVVDAHLVPRVGPRLVVPNFDETVTEVSTELTIRVRQSGEVARVTWF